MPDDLVIKHINGERALPKLSVPPPLEHQFLEDDGVTPVDLTTGVWTGQGRAEKISLGDGETQPAGIGAGTVTINVPTATATYPWVIADFTTPGRFRIILWIGNGTQRFGSTTYEWDVSDAPGIDPTV